MRQLLQILLLLSCFALSTGHAGEQKEPVRIGLTPVFLDDQAGFLYLWRNYLSRELGRPVKFIQRGSYREITDMLRQGKLDYAWLCGFPFIKNRASLKLLAVPEYQGKPLYQSYLIVPATRTETAALGDLRGTVFAYSDPDSNSGFLYTQYRLFQDKDRSSRFFRRTFFTGSHRKVVEAVASGLAQGGAVDGYVWDTLAKLHPDLTGRTRVVEKSPEFGFPPFVARADTPEADFQALRGVLLGMKHTAEGRDLLTRLNLDGFVAGDPALFQGIARMVKAVDNRP